MKPPFESFELQDQGRPDDPESNFAIDDSDNDGDHEAPEIPFDDRINDDIDYYPNVSHHGRHTILEDEGEYKSRGRRLWYSLRALFNTSIPTTVVVWLTGAIAIVIIMVLGVQSTARASDYRDAHPQNSRLPNSYKDAEDSISLTPVFADPSGTSASKKNLTLKEERMGLYYSFPYSAEFVDVDVDGIIEKRDHDLSDEGYYIHKLGSVWLLKKAADSKFERQLFDDRVPEYKGKTVKVSLLKLDPTVTKALVSSDKESQFRHSSVARYWILDLVTFELEPIYKLENGDVPKLSSAQVSPKFNYVSFVYNNNLYIRDFLERSVLSVTQDGSVDVFNGKPDWIYEEEVLGSGDAIYWTSDESKFAFITFNDTDVPSYDLEFFEDWQYPKVVPLKYPKVGSANPKLRISVYDVKQGYSQVVGHSDSILGDDFIVYDMAWVTGDELIIKETDRTSRTVDMRLFNSETGESKVVRTINTADEYSGWYYSSGDTNRLFALPHNGGYIDKIVVGIHSRLAYYSSPDSKEPTSILGDDGDWEAMTSVVGYDDDKKLVYFLGTGGSALQRIIYQWDITKRSLTSLSNTTMLEDYDAQFSSHGKYSLLKYQGPDVPWQRFINMERYLSDSAYREANGDDNDVNTNYPKALYDTMGSYAIPSKLYQTITLDDNVTVEVVEVRPSNFDIQKEYPILVSVYGGPGLQKLSCRYNYGFEEVVVSSLDAIVLYVDPRGTGGRDWKFQSYAKDKIGFWEPRDVTEVVRKYIDERRYIDPKKTAIWGWSYGGFTTLKTLEYDGGETFAYGMAVAPVTNWKLYDSIYTERYMGLPKDNENYEKTSQISDIEKFKKVQRFLIMHGTGDDNVHFQNTLQLLNKFDLATVENYDMRVFPDSNHNIVHDNAQRIVYDKLYEWLKRAFEGRF
ncbi:DEKNAAC102924 [Brettanomyces naardenensis]|uniref:DEKNAAC102924 n=1 Tax=Brettanomyces naardenensis TaxID=13370 RepID=A0A448YLW1_BRENA|nr:DEKNAAC102924 [Brettanomyces naardenensis]